MTDEDRRNREWIDGMFEQLGTPLEVRALRAAARLPAARAGADGPSQGSQSGQQQAG